MILIQVPLLLPTGKLCGAILTISVHSSQIQVFIQDLTQITLEIKRAETAATSVASWNSRIQLVDL